MARWCATTASAYSSRCSPAGYSEGDAAEATFPEYVQRPHVGDADEVHITFAEETGRGFYDQIEDAVAAGDEDPFFDFSKMPTDWHVPTPVR